MKTLMLVGGGHAHLHCLSQLHAEGLENCRVVLISPSRFQYYSGMLSGFAEGVYAEEELSIDLRKFAEACGAEYIEDGVAAIDPGKRELIGRDGAVYRYDVVSFAIGSAVALPPAAENFAEQPKPNDRLIRLIGQMKETERPVIVGGGAAGTELALTLHAARQKAGLPPPLLLSSGALLAGLGRNASLKAEAIARAKGLPFQTGSPAAELDDGSITAESGERYEQSDVLWMSGPASFPVFRGSGLAVDDKGFLLVNGQLQSLHEPNIFGAGDCVSLEAFPTLPKNGVHAVRQGPVLWHNLKARMVGGELQAYAPQKRVLAILSTGGGEALLTYGRFALHGKLAWKWKERIDRKFVEKYQRLYE